MLPPPIRFRYISASARPCGERSPPTVKESLYLSPCVVSAPYEPAMQSSLLLRHKNISDIPWCGISEGQRHNCRTRYGDILLDLPLIPLSTSTPLSMREHHGRTAFASYSKSNHLGTTNYSPIPSEFLIVSRYLSSLSILLTSLINNLRLLDINNQSQ